MDIQEYQKLLMQGGDLHPDLTDYVRTTGVAGMSAIHHPVIVEVPYFPQMNALINLRYEQKLEAMREYAEDGKWVNYLAVIERPYRAEKLLEIMQEHSITRTEAAEMMEYVWTDSENIYEMKDVWEELWNGFHDSRPDDFMDKPREFMDRLFNGGDKIKAYRGFSEGSAADQSFALSWTLSYQKAKWFANRWKTKGGTPTVLTREVTRSEILAFFDGRNEKEVVLSPEYVGHVTVHIL